MPKPQLRFREGNGSISHAKFTNTEVLFKRTLSDVHMDFGHLLGKRKRESNGDGQPSNSRQSQREAEVKNLVGGEESPLKGGSVGTTSLNTAVVPISASGSSEALAKSMHTTQPHMKKNRSAITSDDSLKNLAAQLADVTTTSEPAGPRIKDTGFSVVADPSDANVE